MAKRVRTYGDKDKATKAAYRAANLDRINAVRAVREATPEAIAKKIAYEKAYYAKHVVRKTLEKKAWFERNKEACQARAAARRAAHPEVHQAWVARNRPANRAIAAKCRAMRALRTPPWLTAGHEAQIRSWFVLAAATGREVDHIYPLCGKHVSGLHVPWNLQLLTQSENRSKGNRMQEAA